MRAGGVGIIAQSGIYVAGLLNQLMERSCFGVSTVASLGNACDVGAADVFEYLADDPATSVIALHLEGLSEGARLLRAARSVAGRKPVVAALVGGSESGAEASRSHTANLAVPGRITPGLLAQAGIVPAREFADLADLAGAYSLMGTPRPARRVATISTSGGAGVIAADYADELGIEMARLAPATRARLGAVHPFARGVDNPIDAWPAMERHGTAAVMPEMAGAIFHDPGVDAVVFGMGAYSGGGAEFDPRMVGEAHARSGKPAVAWLYGPSASLDTWRTSLEAIGIPCFRDLRGAVTALAGWDRMYRRALEPQPAAVAMDPDRVGRLRAVVAAARAAQDAAGAAIRRRLLSPGEPVRASKRASGTGALESAMESDRRDRSWAETDPAAGALSPHGAPSLGGVVSMESPGNAASPSEFAFTEMEALELLDALGVSAVARERVRTPDEAAAAAGRFGWPVVLKAVSRDLAHKTEVGAVETGLDSEPALRAAWRTISDSVALRATEACLDGMMVQSMLRGREVIAGLVLVPGVGPVVMVGSGGVFAESRADVAFRLPPLDDAEADRMIEESGVALVLGPHRGRPAGDRPAVREVLLRLGALAECGIGISEIEINPLVVGDEGGGATAVDALVVVAGR